MNRRYPGKAKDKGHYGQRAEESRRIGELRGTTWSSALLEHCWVRSHTNEPRVGAEGSHEFLSWNSQVCMEPISHTRELGLYPVIGGQPSEGFLLKHETDLWFQWLILIM